MTVTSDDDDDDVFKIVMIIAVSVLGVLLIMENIIVCYMYCKKRGLFRRDPFSDDTARLEEFIKATE